MVESGALQGVHGIQSVGQSRHRVPLSLQDMGETYGKGLLMDESGISWIRFIQFCFHFEILPVKLQAVRLSMKADDYIRLLGKMKNLGLIPASIACEALRGATFIGSMYRMLGRYDIEKHLPPFPGKEVYDTEVDSSFFERANTQIGLDIVPLKNGTAFTYDYLTGMPLGKKNAVMLSFGHPLGIAYWTSESCVKRYRDILKKYLC